METQVFPKRIELRFSESGTQVLVVPKNHDLFVLSAKEAAMACQRHEEIKRFEEQVRRLLKKLGRWLCDHLDKVSDAFVTIRDGGLLFLVIRNSVPYDEDLEHSLVDLELAIARDPGLDIIPLSVLALPSCSEESYQTFLNPGCVWVYSGE